MQTKAVFRSWRAPSPHPPALCCVVCWLIILTRNLLVLFPNWRSVITGNINCLQEERGVSYQLTQLPPPLSHPPPPLLPLLSSTYLLFRLLLLLLVFFFPVSPSSSASSFCYSPPSLFPPFAPSFSFGPSYLFLLLPFFSLLPPP